MTNTGLATGVIGDGGWGTAFALTLLEKGHRVRVWGHAPAYLDAMRAERANPRFLPGIPLPPSLRFEPDLDKMLAESVLLFCAVPTPFLRAVLAGRKTPAAPVVSLTKGIEQDTLLRPTEVLAACLPGARLAALAGPSHAEEVARKLPATVVVAADDDTLAREVQAAAMTPTFRIYTSRDVVGVELAGALKNVIALAAGICTGLELGDNAMAALVARGLAEMRRLGAAAGADDRTFAGIAGVGDLVTTCISPHGRNRAVGIALGRGETLAEIMASRQTVAEGVTTAQNALSLARRLGVELPITEAVCAVLFHDKPPRQAVAELMAREGVPEH